jgi:hypothetical protein
MMTAKEELIQAIERSPDEVVRVLLDLVRLWQQPHGLQKDATTSQPPQPTPELPKTAWAVLRTYAGSRRCCMKEGLRAGEAW